MEVPFAYHLNAQINEKKWPYIQRKSLLYHNHASYSNIEYEEWHVVRDFINQNGYKKSKNGRIFLTRTHLQLNEELHTET
jgi:hypothetical protein